MNEPQGETIDITPDPNLIFAICEQSALSWKLCLGELIDNAFDAGAVHVEIVFGPISNGRCSYMVVRDTGNGCKDLAAMLTLGRHTHQKTTKLGRYGIGLKDAVLWIGGRESETSIRTVHQGDERCVSVNWKALARSGRWRVDMPAAAKVEQGVSSSTTITVAAVARRVPDGQAWAGLQEDLGYLYAPGLKRGRQIVVRKEKSRRGATEPGTPLERYCLPELEDRVDQPIELFGKTARVYAGIVKEGHSNRRPGLTYSHGFRVIREACSDGCGDHGISRIAGCVDLDDAWTLTKNKDDVAESKEELLTLVYQVVKPLLLKAESLGRDQAQVDLAQELTELFRANLRGEGEPDAKAKRGEGDSKGRVDPTGKGSKHTRARDEQAGGTFPSAHGGTNRGLSNMRVDFADLGPRGGIGQIQEGRSVRVILNTHGGLSRAIQAGDRGSLARTVAALLAHRLTYEPGQLRLWGTPAGAVEGSSSEKFSQYMALLLGSSADGGARQEKAA